MKVRTSVIGLAALLSACEGISVKSFSWADLTDVQIAHAASVMQEFCTTQKKLDTVKVVQSYHDFETACQAFHDADYQLLAFQQAFMPAQIQKKSYMFFHKPAAKVTAYYTPSLKGSFTRTAQYNVPVRSKPKDMVRVHTQAFDETQRDVWVGMVQNGKVVPYHRRIEIEAAQSPALFYTDSLIDKFFLQVQGSGFVNFDNGEKRLAAFAAHNGRAYTSIGKSLVEKGALTLDDANMFSIKTWLKTHPDTAEDVLNENERYIFFGWGNAVKGSSGRTLETFKSAAIDPKTLTYGLPFILSTTQSLDGAEKTFLLRADDTGGAIRGVGRVDIYAGEGEFAEKMAAYQNSPGEMVVFLPRPL